MMPLWVDDTEEKVIYQYFEHPRHFITENVLEWFDEYQYYKEFSGTAPKYESVSCRFIEAKNIYEGYLQFWKTPNVNNEGYS